MIFIVGTKLTEDQLPDFTEYKIFADSNAMGAKVALRVASDLTVAYINKKFESTFAPGGIIPESVYKKCVFFGSDEEVLKLINGENKEEKTEINNVDSINNINDDNDDNDINDVNDDNTLLDNVDENKSNVIELPQTINENNKTNGVEEQGNSIAEDVRRTEPTVVNKYVDEDIIFSGNNSLDKVRDIEEDDDFDIETFKIPTSSVGNYDAVSAKLEAKERQLDQYKSLMTEKVNEYEDLIKELDADRENIIKQYDAKIKEAQEAFSKAQATINILSNTTGKYHTYAERHKMMLSEVFDPSVKESIKALGLNLMVMFAEGGVDNMQYLASQSIEQFKENCVFIDLTGESYFDMMYKSKFGDALRLFDEMSDSDIENFKSKVVHKENADIIAEYLFHDIMFLDADWLRFFTNVKRLFGTERKIVLMLGSVASFPVSYTISRLSTLFNTYIHFKCSFPSIKSAFNHLRFFPNGRNIRIIATFLFDEANSAINKLGEKYAVTTSADILSIATIDKR